jgi:predicted nucleic acid-binding protein
MPLALLDTDILSEVLKQKNPDVASKATDYLAQYQQFAISAITRYEIVRGLKATNATTQLQKFHTFCQHSVVYPISDDILIEAADLWVDGHTGGHPHRDADLIIAATALRTGRVLVTGNTDHFSWIPGLSVEDWRKP